ncbi:hypothetical protein PMG11_07011 [Penicillium brasilianum]|uniref:Uncharacterized protein n=1 Tax=Penicillium brasilianum TaxID=104259 RepID=A0A0F7TTF2_PENBI|nr:hypothetical protein PMG11_07011 [Penicillium brasilianum]
MSLQMDCLQFSTCTFSSACGMASHTVEVNASLKHEEPVPYRILGFEGEVLLSPTPCDDPADPLNWPTWRRWTILGFLSLWAATCLATQSFISNILPNIEVEFASASASNINLLVTIITAVCAPSSLIFVPLVITYGRRFALLVSNTILLVSVIWAALATSYSSFLGSRILQAVGTAPSDAIVYIIVQDISFLHERGKLMGVVLNQPERRGAMSTTQHKAMKHSAAYISNKSNFSLARQLNIWPGCACGQEGDFFFIYKRMGRLILNPTIWWNGILNATITGGMVAYTTYFANLLFAPPWSWPGEYIGLINLAGVPVSLVNWLIFGWGSDWILVTMAKKNKGISIPEHRLLVLVIPVAIAFASYIGFGALAEQYLDSQLGVWQPHWFVLIFLHFCILVAFSGTLEVTYTYMISTTDPTDSLAASTIVSILRGDVSFGISHGSTAFIAQCGYMTAFSVYGTLVAVFGFMGILVYKYGSHLRLYLRTEI